ncbi:hypothetical protein ATI61_11720 [Archangium gephyra]|uniref:Uncharacterized protein n=1 Tax=Archangium gephyra TaxID=48 RepID=A0AAC8Q813_9BACT|nr:hypothetical protein [Archangium gephyra]AKJ02630.1 Hypothetical protein AA314_04256 [Archangium gephyra]REG23177.1 hypothetical protein ATI61_11720 [Archangium gephyra]
MVRKLTAAAAALATLTVSCAPPTQSPTKVRALVLSSNGEYAPTEVELKTITDIVAMEGQVMKVVGGAHIRVDSQDPELSAAQTEEAYMRAVLKDVGRPVTASYITDEKGVLWPADFHTWNLVTTYYNLERAWEYFTVTAEVKQAELPQTTTYYFPELVLADLKDEPQIDNAMYFSPVQAFMVLPFKTIEKAPMALNASILTHEYAHLVFNRRVYEGRSIPTPLQNWALDGSTPGLNALKSLDEGLADFHAYVASCQTSYNCNPRVLYTTLEGPKSEARDLSRKWCMGTELSQSLFTANFGAFDPAHYQVGTIMASALYESAATSPAWRQVLARAVVAAYSDVDPAKPGLAQLAKIYNGNQSGFTLARALRSIIQHIPNGEVDLKTRVCSNLATRLRIPLAALSGGTDAGPSDCPEGATINDCSIAP